jgi:AAA family ATP:ADP antiporter
MLTAQETPTTQKSLLDRALSLFTEVRAGEGATAVLMLLNIFLLLVCYAVIKTVREPLILLGGGAEIRSYAAAGQAILLMAFVPLYSWCATRFDRTKLLVGVTLFFIFCIELFASAVAGRVPYVGVAFFIWVGIFNVSLVAQFWSFANDIYTKDAGDRLFPIIVIGMTAGAPLGSFVAGRLFRSGIGPQLILQVSAALLAASVLLYLWINTREKSTSPVPAQAMSASGGFQLVLGNGYLRLIALLVVLLNVVNSTGEYMVARLLTAHANELAAANAAFDKQAYIGGFSGDYQFWVNVTAFLIQAFVTSRLVKYRGLAGALLALPLVALGGYAMVAAGVGFSVVRWIKTAENAADYSIMNTGRQLLWLTTSREEKYKAKQAIDSFFVRGGDVLSAAVVYLGAGVWNLNVQQFAFANVMLTLVWIGVAVLILKPQVRIPGLQMLPLARAAAIAMLVFGIATQAHAQDTRTDALAAEKAAKAADLHPYEPNKLEKRLEKVQAVTRMLEGPVYPFIGDAYEGGGVAIGPGYRARFGDTGTFGAHAAWSLKNYKAAEATLGLPTFGRGRVKVEMQASWLDAPEVAFYGVGNDSSSRKGGFSYGVTTLGISSRVQTTRRLFLGGGLESIHVDATPIGTSSSVSGSSPNYRRSYAFAEIDSRNSPGYARKGGLYKVEWSDYRQTNTGRNSFQRLDADVRQFVPLMRENWVIALRALGSVTNTGSGEDVPYFMMPDLGGSHRLRGYPAWRFRDRNRLLFSGEYRWTAGSFVDMSLFLDAGQVARRVEDLSLRSLKTTYGVGVSFHTFTSTVTRIEVARSSKGTALVLGFGPSF